MDDGDGDGAKRRRGDWWKEKGLGMRGGRE